MHRIYGTITIVSSLIWLDTVIFLIFYHQYILWWNSHKLTTKSTVISSRIALITIVAFILALGLWLLIDIFKILCDGQITTSTTNVEIVSLILVGIADSSLLGFEISRLYATFKDTPFSISNKTLTILSFCMIIQFICETASLIFWEENSWIYNNNNNNNNNTNGDIMNIFFWICFIISVLAMIVIPSTITYLFYTKCIEQILMFRMSNNMIYDQNVSQIEQGVISFNTQQAYLTFLENIFYIIWSFQSIFRIFNHNVKNDDITIVWIFMKIIDFVAFIYHHYVCGLQWNILHIIIYVVNVIFVGINVWRKKQ